MTPLQWQIIETAHAKPEHTYALERHMIAKAHAAGEHAPVNELLEPLLQDIGKRYGLVPWVSDKEKASYRRFQSAARSGMLRPGGRRRRPARQGGAS